MERIIEIPEGYKARIEGNKVVIGPKESEDERIIERLLEYFRGFDDRFSCKNNVNVRWKGLEVKKVIAYLEKQKKQKEQKPAECTVPHSAIYDHFMLNLHTIIYNYGKQIAAKCLGTHVLDTKLNEYVTDEDVDKYIKKHISCFVSLYPLLTPAE